MTPDLTYSIIIVLTVVCAFTYAFEIIFGLAGTIIMLFIMSYFIDTRTLIVYSTLPQIMVASIGLWRSPNTVKFKFLANMLGFAAIGSVAGMLLFYQLTSKTLEMILAIAIFGFGLYLVFSPSALKLNKTIRAILDFFAGLSQQLFGISGPIAMTRIMASVTHKTQIRNYALAFFLSLNIIRLGSYLWQSLLVSEQPVLTPSILLAMAISAPVLFVTLWTANHLHFKIKDRLFKKTVSWIILLGGFQLFFKVLLR